MQIFDQQAAEYDAWYDTPGGAAVFAAERAALAPLLAGLPRPWLEVGVGTGRFAAALGVEFGIDPARRALALAGARGIQVAAARGEQLPFRDHAFGAVLLVVTLCFVDDAPAVLREARRVLRADGALVLGIVPADSPLGERYRRLGAGGHPYYSQAHFFTRAEIDELLVAAGMRRQETRSVIMETTDADIVAPIVCDGDHPRSDLLALRAV